MYMDIDPWGTGCDPTSYSFGNVPLNLMLTEQPYLDSELHLAALSLKVDISTHKLSQVLNEYLHKNFFDFINEYCIFRVY